MQTNIKSSNRAARRAQNREAAALNKLSMSNNLMIDMSHKPLLTSEQEKNIRVGFTAVISNPLGEELRLDFSADLDRFRTIYKHVKSYNAPIEVVKRSYHREVVNLFNSNEPATERFFTCCMHYVACLDSVEKILITNPKENIGFQVAISTDSDEPNLFIPMGYAMWFELVKRYNNK
jgi:hypothetical protein